MVMIACLKESVLCGIFIVKIKKEKKNWIKISTAKKRRYMQSFYDAYKTEFSLLKKSRYTTSLILSEKILYQNIIKNSDFNKIIYFILIFSGF